MPEFKTDFFNGWKFKDLLFLVGFIGTIYVGLYRVGQLEAREAKTVAVIEKMEERQNDLRVAAEGRERRVESIEKRLDKLEEKLNR